MAKGLALAWAAEEFGTAALGDARRTARLLHMAGRAAVAPAGTITEVFRNGAERQGAYDLLESPHVRSVPIHQAQMRACAARCSAYSFVFVPVDGTSLSLVDRGKDKEFGSIGSYSQGASGLKIIDAIAVSPDGVPLGVAAMQWWARPQQRGRRRPNYARKIRVKDKETQHWLDAITEASNALAEKAPSTRLWYQLDREADSWPVLRHLQTSGHLFTVRSRSDRRLRAPSSKRHHLRETLRRQRPLAVERFHVPAGHRRTKRTARMELRACTVSLDLVNSWSKSRFALEVNVVWAREQGTCPKGEKPLDWLLLTNHPIRTLADVHVVIFGYTQRWRIEDFHRTWKSGACGIEKTQLRTCEHVMKWATILASVALRIERLKHLSRVSPELPANVELTARELEALFVLKEQRSSKPSSSFSPSTLTIGQATRWIADLGGYTGKSSGGPPGATTIRRGLERLLLTAEVLEALAQQGKLR